MNSWISLFCSYAIFNLLFSFFSWVLRCSTSSFSDKFRYFTSSSSSILFFSSSSILLSLWILSSSSKFAYNIFFSWSLASSLTLLPRRNAAFIYFNLIANYSCLFFSFYFYCSKVNALFFSSSFLERACPNTCSFSFYNSFSFYFCSLAVKFYLFAETLTLLSITWTPSGGRVPSNCFFSL